MTDAPITPRQRAFIEDMNEFCEEKFNLDAAPTKSQASAYISRNIDEFKLKTMSEWALKNGYF